MGRNRKAPVAAENTGLHVSYGGGQDSTAVQLGLLARYASEPYVAGPSRGEGVKILRNPDYVENTGGIDKVERLSDLWIRRIFRAWGPESYPRLKYDTPAAVQRGFVQHLALTGDRPLPPEPFVVDPARYGSRGGMASDMRGMMAVLEAAERAGRTVYHPTEAEPGSAEDRRLAYGLRRQDA